MSFLRDITMFINDFQYSRDTTFGAWYVPWIGIGVYVCIVYVLFFEMYVKHEPYRLVHFSRIHNVILCIWSGIMMIAILYHLGYHILVRRRSIKYVIMDPDLEVYESMQFWFYLYYLSKYYELIDTFILLLKKKRVIFLHLWHHAIMMYFGWLWIDAKFTVLCYGTWLNNLIHVLMYYYYFVSTFGVRVWWKRHLTKLQIIQFILMHLLMFYWCSQCFEVKDNWRHYDFLYGDVRCSSNYTKPWVILVTQVVILSFLVLFAHFYYQQYTFKKNKGKKA
eukprot:175062_1